MERLAKKGSKSIQTLGRSCATQAAFDKMTNGFKITDKKDLKINRRTNKSHEANQGASVESKGLEKIEGFASFVRLNNKSEKKLKKKVKAGDRKMQKIKSEQNIQADQVEFVNKSIKIISKAEGSQSMKSLIPQSRSRKQLDNNQEMKPIAIDSIKFLHPKITKKLQKKVPTIAPKPSLSPENHQNPETLYKGNHHFRNNSTSKSSINALKMVKQVEVAIPSATDLNNKIMEQQNHKLMLQLQKYKKQCTALQGELKVTLEQVKNMHGQLEKINSKNELKQDKKEDITRTTISANNPSIVVDRSIVKEVEKDIPSSCTSLDGNVVSETKIQQQALKSMQAQAKVSPYSYNYSYSSCYQPVSSLNSMPYQPRPVLSTNPFLSSQPPPQPTPSPASYTRETPPNPSTQPQPITSNAPKIYTTSTTYSQPQVLQAQSTTTATVLNPTVISPTVISSSSTRVIRLGRDRSYCTRACPGVCTCLIQQYQAL